MKNGLDTLLIPSLRKTIEKNLGKKTLNKIEQRLVERHGMTIAQAIKDFYKFDSVLREFFGAGADGLETKFLKSIVDIDKPKKNSLGWITIQDQELVKVFLESFGDDNKKCILNTVLGNPLIVAEILETCNIPQTSGYRKINSLIKDGLLVQNGYSFTNDRKKVTKYEALFQNIKIDIEKNTVKVKIQLRKKSVDDSSILQIIKI